MGDFEWGWLKLNPDFFLVLSVILLSLLLMILSSKCNELNYHVDSINKNDSYYSEYILFKKHFMKRIKKRKLFQFLFVFPNIFHSRQVGRPGDSSIVFLSKYFSFLTST